MRLSKETRQAYVALLACVVFGAAIRALQHYVPFNNTYAPLSFVCHTMGLILWMRLLRRRFVCREVLLLLSSIVAFLLQFLFVQTLKYEFVLDGTAFSRLLWYAYYVPISFVPTLIFLSVLYIGRRQGEAIDRRWFFLLVVPAILSLLMLTNDMHQLAFRFDVELGTGVLTNDRDGYVHGPVFYACWAWMAIMGVGSLLVARAATSRGAFGTKALMPVAVIVLMVGILPFYGLAMHVEALEICFKFPDMTCILVVAFMEAMVVAGFFPANEGYGAIWQASSLRGGFVDLHGNLEYVSLGSPNVTASQAGQALGRPILLEGGNDLLMARCVVGGISYWVRDLSAINTLRGRLENLGDSLAQEHSMLVAENELAKSRESLVQRQDLYARVVDNTVGQLLDLEGLLDTMPVDDEEFLDQMRHASVLAAYIKRCANLTLVGENGLVDARELALALDESAECLRAIGVEVEMRVDPAGMIFADDALKAYAAFEAAVEETLPSLSRVCLSIDHIGEALELRCEIVSDAPCTVETRLPLAGDSS